MRFVYISENQMTTLEYVVAINISNLKTIVSTYEGSVLHASVTCNCCRYLLATQSIENDNIIWY